MKKFFQLAETKTVLVSSKHILEALATNSEFDAARNMHIGSMLDSILAEPELWDRYCQINIGWLGTNYRNALGRLNGKSKKSDLDDIFATSYRYLLELYLSQKHDLSREIEEARTFGITELDMFEAGAKYHIDFALRHMPLSIFKAITNNEQITSLKDFNVLIGEAKELKSNWTQELVEKKRDVDALKDDLDKYQTGFNFVGLRQGFDELAAKKIEELGHLVKWIKIICVIVVTPAIFELLMLALNWGNISNIQNELLLSIFPALSIMAISLYFFRVLLFNYKSVKSQLLQIDLRRTLCRFIQSYADYSADIGEKNNESLQKFESIIFSGIVTDDGALPSTYEGIDQMGKLIKSIKG